MKTFEERYTAWIDGQLEGDALAAFEQELARRAEAGDAEAAETDRAQALGLRALLKEHLQAPALTNAEFFSHQMRERIDAEIEKVARRREAAARPAWQFPAFAWPFARLAGVGLACLFVAGALYYGMMPPHQADTTKMASTNNVPAPQPTAADAVAKNDPAPSPASQVPDARPKDNQLAFQNVPTPAPVDLGEEIHVQPNPGSTTSATPLHYDKANVLWVSGLPYLPNVAGASPSPAPAMNTTPAPTPSAAPSTVP